MPISDLFKKKKCRICGQKTSETLSSNSKQWDYYCRTHLVEAFAERFLEFPHKMVIREPEPEATKWTGYVYGYYPKPRVCEFGWEEEDAETLSCLLEGIASRACLTCRSGPAQVLYVASSRASWKDYEYDIARDYEDLGEYLCLRCSWARLPASSRDLLR